MEGNMKVAVMNGIGKMGYTERPIPVPKDDEVLVKLEYVGICGSDMHYYEMGRIGDYVVEPPFVLGHEPGGTVVEVGKNVTHLKVGDRVALEPGKTCGKCKFCREGKYNLCPDVVFFATPPVDGVFQEYVAHEAGLCFKLPDNVSTLEGALIEPLSVGLYFNTVFGPEFWRSQPARYPDSYYPFLSTKVRVNVFAGQRVELVLPSNRRKFVKSITAFYELSTCDLYLRALVQDGSVSLCDIFGLSLGLKFQLF